MNLRDYIQPNKVPAHIRYAEKLNKKIDDEYSEVYPLDSEVYAKYQNSNKWMKGIIIRIYGNNCFDILYENGRKESRVPAERMAKDIGGIKL